MSPAAGLTVDIRPRQAGQGGEFYTKNPDAIPPAFLKRYRNCTFENDAWETEPGTSRLLGSIGEPVGSLIQWSPGPGLERLIAHGRATGRLYKSVDQGENWSVIYSGMAPGRLVVFIEGGEEAAGNPRKLFAFGAGEPIVVVGDGNGNDGIADPIAPPTALAGGSGGIEPNTYAYVWTALWNTGETLQSPGAFVTLAVPSEVHLSIPAFSGSIARRLYRAPLDQALLDFTAWHLVEEFAGDAVTTYTDTLPDSALLPTGLPVRNTTASVHQLAKPAFDWLGGNWPTSAVMAEGRLMAFGIGAQANHLIYVSTGDDHEDFLTEPRVIPCYPGEGDGLVAACFWRGNAFFWKQPRGIYRIDTRPIDVNFWIPVRHSGAVGIAGPLSWVQIKAPEGGQFFDDVIFIHTDGSWHRMSKVDANQEGDVNVSSISEISYAPFIKENVDLRHLWYTQMAYFEDIEEIQGCFRKLGSPDGELNNMRIKANFQRLQEFGIRFHHSDFPTCPSIAMSHLLDGSRRPMCGGVDGIVRLINDPTSYTYDGGAYTSEFWTHDDNFQDVGQGQDGKLAYKLFHFLTLEFESTGAWNITLEVIIDGVVTQVLAFPMQRGGFVLDQSQLGTPLGGTGLARYTRRLRGRGHRIAFHGYIATAGQRFRIINMTLGWTLANIPGGNKL